MECRSKYGILFLSRHRVGRDSLRRGLRIRGTFRYKSTGCYHPKDLRSEYLFLPCNWPERYYLLRGRQFVLRGLRNEFAPDELVANVPSEHTTQCSLSST